MLIDAVGRLKVAGQLGEAVVVLAGDARGAPRLPAGPAQPSCTGRPAHEVRLVGHVEDMAAAYLAAQVTVVASTEPEAFGRTAIEAGAMGSPVIATAIGAPPGAVWRSPRFARTPSPAG